MPISNSWKTLTWCQESRIVTSTLVTKEACVCMVGFADNGRPEFPVHAVSAPRLTSEAPGAAVHKHTRRRTQTVELHGDCLCRVEPPRVEPLSWKGVYSGRLHFTVTHWVHTHNHGGMQGGQLPNHSLNNLQLSTQTKKNLNAQGFFFVKFVSPQLACRPFHTILYITHKLMLTLLLWVYKSRREQKVSNFGSYFPHFTPNKVLINDND